MLLPARVAEFEKIP